jgi:DNA primase
MNTPSGFVGFDTLKHAVSMIQVLDRYGLSDRFQRTGDTLRGACPIHAGHNPTQFRVSLARNCWICFGDCNGGGSIIDFVSRKEGVGIREAGLLIQQWFGVAPTRANAPPPHAPTRDRPPAPEPRSAPATNPPLRFALGHLDGSHPYLAGRGLSAVTVQTFGIGGCARGLLAGRIAIPIHNATGQLVAYAGRWPGVPPAGQPKYRLPRGFRKSLELFNLHRARTATGPLIVVEGFFGCMKVWQAGFHRVVALMGSRLSSAQEQGIVQTVGPGGNVLLALDEDAAGRQGRADASERLSRRVAVRVVELGEEGVQPDDLLPERLHAMLR